MSQQGSLFIDTTTPYPAITVTPEVMALLLAGCVVAIGVSGGGDSVACALAVLAWLDGIGHTGPRVLVHAHLGRVEWKDSLPTCRRLAERTGLELIIVARAAGDMMDRWLTRWSNNCDRYANLECVKLILPWSTASMRFCTSELKTAVICRELVKRFPGQTILSVAGIRRDESPKRKLAPIVKQQNKLTSKAHNTTGYDWHPILDWTKEQVFRYHEEQGFAPHEAYRVWGSSRVSCAFCILGSQSDLAASAGCPDNESIYREMCRLEIDSTFSFQDGKWLGDVAPQLLDEPALLVEAKRRARLREQAEARIPAHLLYTEGWPTVMPTYAEAELLANVREHVAYFVGLEIRYTEPEAILERYAELMAARPAGSAIAPDITEQMAML